MINIHIDEGVLAITKMHLVPCFSVWYWKMR